MPSHSSLASIVWSITAIFSVPLAGGAHRGAGPIVDAEPLAIGDVVPNLRFTDQDAKVRVLSDWRGRDELAIGFIYTQCSDLRMCPLVSAKFATVSRELRARHAHLILFTIDPLADRPKQLLRYTKRYQFDLSVLTLGTGNPRILDRFRAAIGVSKFKLSDRRIIHTERVAIVAPDGRISSFLDANAWSPEELITELDVTAGRDANPLARLNLLLSNGVTSLCGNAVADFSGATDLAAVCALLLIAVLGGIYAARYVFGAK